MDIAKIIAKWQREAENLRRRGAEPLATLLESCAADLREFGEQWCLEQLTVTQAAKESGYSKDTISRFIKDGLVENVGRKGAPRVRRCDLPSKPGLRLGEPDVAGEILRARGHPTLSDT